MAPVALESGLRQHEEIEVQRWSLCMPALDPMDGEERCSGSAKTAEIHKKMSREGIRGRFHLLP